MLFGYSIAATTTENNWVHECVCQAVRGIHGLVDANQVFPVWPNLLPMAYREVLKRRKKLCEFLKAYDVAVRTLAKAERDFVLAALESENRIPELLSGTADCARMDELPQIVREPIAALFNYAFDILGPRELNVRTPHYAAIHRVLATPVCPFCGICFLSSPGGPQEDLDHYLARSIYPFAAANLRNLVPMCHDCNTKYKLDADMVRCSNAARRMAFDPYNFTAKVKISVEGSKPFIKEEGAMLDAQHWTVAIIPQTPEVQTWNDVFSVCERYKRNHLQPWYKRWVDNFIKYARKSMGVYSEQGLIDMLRSHEENLEDEGISDRAFLKAAVFRMLRLHCEAGYQDALDHLRGWLYPPTDALVAASEAQPEVEHSNTSESTQLDTIPLPLIALGPLSGTSEIPTHAPSLLPAESVSVAASETTTNPLEEANSLRFTKVPRD